MNEHVCPVWVGYLLANPLRKLIQNPHKILKNYITKGMEVLDFGCAMGYFSIPMAKMVGETGKVYCVDLQEKMLVELDKKVKKKNLSKIMELRNCSTKSINMNDKKESIDFALAFAVVHETPDDYKVLKEIHQSLTKKGKLLISDPKVHVSKEKFLCSLESAKEIGFRVLEYPEINHSMSVLMEKI